MNIKTSAFIMLLLFSSPSFSVNSTFNQNSGVLVIPQVNVNGILTYSNVTLQHENGAFKIISYDKVTVPNPSFPFSDTANRPGNIGINTVISTLKHGMWVVTVGNYYAGDQTNEEIYVYQNGTDIELSWLVSGAICTVIQMPDPSPIISSTSRPANTYIGTILMLSNGQVWEVTSGSYYFGSVATEKVIIYQMSDNYYMSFQTSGATMTVNLIK